MNELKILVVEDEQIMQERLVEMLYKTGASHVVACEDAAGARKAFGESRFHIILLDLGLPDGNGHDLMEEFKATYEDQHIVLVTADDSIESIQKAISAGANGYVVKPYSQEKIHDVVNNYIMVHGEEPDITQGLNRRH